ncbi:unnamed protein product [Phytomonas sp. EM1]|nr:unnamed protein product [Phytomonas sp. EM1]|eukprot:CCW63352.1 unnamed protein product [Phytomonas sp. isolate EM1]
MAELELIAVRVKDGIFIGNITAAEDGEFLSMNKITHIINCTGDEIGNLFAGNPQFKYISFPWKDTLSSVCPTMLFDVSDENINRAVQFIDEAVNSGNCVLVHSCYGISRSPTLVAAYLMIKYDWKLESAFSFLHMSHPDMLIKPHFLRQLRLFAKRHHIDCDIFDKEVNDSEFGLDNDQWMLRNTFLNGLCFQEQQLHELHRKCTAKIDVGTRIHTERNKPRVSFVDNVRRGNVDVVKNTSLTNTKSVRHLDPYTDTASDNSISSRGLIALSFGERSLSIMNRSSSPCTRKLESDSVTCPKGRGLFGLVSKENQSDDSFHSTATTTQNFTRSNSKQFSFLRNGSDENRDNQVILTPALEETMHLSTATSSSNLPNYERMAPPKSSISSHHSPYARLTPKHVYRKGSPLPIQNTTQPKVSRAKHSSVPLSRPSRSNSPSSSDISASNRFFSQKIDRLGSSTQNGLVSVTTLSKQDTSTIVRSTSSDYVSIAPRRAVQSSSAKPVDNSQMSTNNRPMITRRYSPSARIPQVLRKSRSPCSKPGFPPQNDLSPRVIRKKGSESTSIQSTRSGALTGASKFPRANASFASDNLSGIVPKKAPSLSAPCSGMLRREPLTSIPSRPK